MNRYMEDEAVMQADAALRHAIERASGETVRNMLVVVETEAGDATSYNGCKCSDCSLKMLTAAARQFRFEDAGDFAPANPKAMAH